MDYPACKKKSCINWEEGHCTLKDPELADDHCLHFADTLFTIRELSVITSQ